MKKEYSSPELSEIQFDTEDVLKDSIVDAGDSEETEVGKIPFSW